MSTAMPITVIATLMDARSRGVRFDLRVDGRRVSLAARRHALMNDGEIRQVREHLRPVIRWLIDEQLARTWEATS